MVVNNKVAIITGSNKGIGEAIARLFSSKGISVVVAARDLKKSEQVAEELKTVNGEAIALKVDVSMRKDVHMMVENTMKKFGRIDILVNNAAISSFTQIEEVTDEEWDSILAINVKGVYNCTKFVVPYMKKNSWGRIINISSSAGKIGGPISSIHYSASKAAVICITKSFARYLASSNITVNCICPGAVEAGMVQQLPEEIKQKAVEAIPLRRLAKPIEIAQAALFLSSEEASYITGETLDVNGGTIMD